MMLQAAVNGARPPAEHPRLSADPAQLARECVAAVHAGAVSLHIHPKDDEGRDSLDRVHIARCLDAVRAACPDTPVGVTTGAWASADRHGRVAAIKSWERLPDFASLNWHEDGADEVASALRARGIGVEAGIWHAEGLRRWLESVHRGDCLRVLIEIQDIASAEEVHAQADRLITAVHAAEPALPVLLHGEERSAWSALRLALDWGWDTRIGLEDTLCLPEGAPAQGNAELVSRVRAMAQER